MVFAANLSVRDSFDPVAQTYIDAVEAADGQALEPEVRRAITRFVKGCKSDGIWNAIKASCVLAGARTLAGALVPLVGSAPTNNNFVSGDYNRIAGLKGDGSSKYLNSNRAGNADPQNSKHMAVYATVADNSDATFIGSGVASTGSASIVDSPLNGRYYLRLHNSTSSQAVEATNNTGLVGINRSSSSNFVFRRNGSSSTFSQSSQTPYSLNIFVFGRNDGGTLNQPNSCRLSFYSIGESLDLALLDTRVSQLMTAISNALS